MKRFAAIMMMGILLFNWVGYRLLVNCMEQDQNHIFETQLDKSAYDESDLISIKIPASALPYYNNSRTFDRVDGQIEIRGISYKYVKRRLYNDSIEIMCIPNLAAIHLQSAKEDFFKITNDLQNTAPNKKDGSHSESKNFSVDAFILSDISFLTNRPQSNNENSSTDCDDLSAAFIQSLEQPPRNA